MHTPVNLYSILVGCKGDWRFGVVAGLFGGYAGERFAGYGVQARAVTRLPRKLVFV